MWRLYEKCMTGMRGCEILSSGEQYYLEINQTSHGELAKCQSDQQ